MARFQNNKNKHINAEYVAKQAEKGKSEQNEDNPTEVKSEYTKKENEQGESKDENIEQNKKKSKKTHRWIILLIVAVIVIVGLIVGIPYYLYAVSHASTDDAFIDAHITFLSSRVAGHVWKLHVNDNQTVNKGDLIIELDPRDFQAKAEQARAALSVAMAQSESAQINISLTEITSYAAVAEANAAVELAQSALNTSKASVAAARSRLLQAQADVEVEKSSLQQSEAQIKAMQALYDRDQTDLKRYQQMYDTNSITQQQLDHATAAANISRANLEAATKQTMVAKAKVKQVEAAVRTAMDNVTEQESLYKEAQSSLNEAKAQLDATKSAPQKIAYSDSQAKAASAQAEQAKAALHQAELELSYAKIYAPISGRVTHKTVEPGNYIVQGQTLMAIVPENVFVTANYKETDLTNMKPGQQVKISIDAYPGVTFRGYVDSIQAGSGAKFSLLPPENATGNYIKVVQRIPVKIIFDEQPNQSKYYIVPGMSVIPEVDITHRPQASKATENESPYTAWMQKAGSQDANNPGTSTKKNNQGVSKTSNQNN